MSTHRKTLNCCQINGQGPPLSRYCNNLIIPVLQTHLEFKRKRQRGFLSNGEKRVVGKWHWTAVAPPLVWCQWGGCLYGRRLPPTDSQKLCSLPLSPTFFTSADSVNDGEIPGVRIFAKRLRK